MLKSGTDLSLGKDWPEDILNGMIGDPRSDKQQKADSVQGTRFNEHSNDDLVQPASSVLRSHSISNVPAVKDETDGDHESEKDVE